MKKVISCYFRIISKLRCYASEKYKKIMGTDMNRKFWIDTDCGIDDAEALFIALKEKDVEVVGISTVNGNIGANQAALNVCKVLKIAGCLNIPVYVGSESELIRFQDKVNDNFHGKDGLGDSTYHITVNKTIENKNGIIAMIDALKNNAGKIELITLGPLTNLALALKLDSNLSSYIKHCYIMGGNWQGVGNVTTCAEFNFFMDPEAAYILLKEMNCKKTIVCWELCLRHRLSWEWYENHSNIDSDKARFIKAINEHNVTKFYNKDTDLYTTADQMLMAVAIHEDIIKKSRVISSTVELNGTHTRGMMIINVDWRGRHVGNTTANLRLIEELDHKMYEKILNNALAN